MIYINYFGGYIYIYIYYKYITLYNSININITYEEEIGGKPR